MRRIVTSQGPGGSKVTSAGVAPVVLRDPGAVITQVWKTPETPVRIPADGAIPAAGPLSLTPPKCGSVFWVVEIPPANGGANVQDGKVLFEKLSNAQAATGHSSRDAMMHRTETLDYGIVIEGEITLVTDCDEVLLEAGDVVVQCGANHAWSNRSGRPCRMAFVMLDGTYPAG